MTPKQPELTDEQRAMMDAQGDAKWKEATAAMKRQARAEEPRISAAMFTEGNRQQRRLKASKLYNLVKKARVKVRQK